MIINLPVKVHPAAELLPNMTDEEFAALIADINEYGQRDPVSFVGDELLDGRHRYAACLELGIEPKRESVEVDNPYQFVLAKNLHRRHLTTSQRAIVAAKVAQHRKAIKQQKLKAESQAVRQSADAGQISKQEADRLNVGTRSVERAEKVIIGGADELQKLVESGGITVSLASESVCVEPDKSKQTNLVKQGERAIKEHIAAKQREFDAKYFRSLANQHRDRLVRAIDDYHRHKPNLKERERLVRLVQGVQLW